MPIYLAEAYREYPIVQITGDDKLKRHLENLGFFVGEPITLINRVDDNVIVKIKGVSLAISRELAKRILV